jgi:hypothetical protein
MSEFGATYRGPPRQKSRKCTGVEKRRPDRVVVVCWDLFPTIRPATKEIVVHQFHKKHVVDVKYVREWLDLLVEDQLILLKTISALRGCKDRGNIYIIPKESEIDLAGKNDWYCFECQKPGTVLNCVSCPRAYHIRCFKGY